MSGQWIVVVGVVLWSLLASQHLFYALGLGTAQRALGGPAYVELRNAIDDAMRRSLPPLYVATLVWTILLIVRGGPSRAFYVVALPGLLGDVGVMATRSLPLNERFHTWSPASPPADWHVHRDAWLDAFRWRQIALSIGF